MTEYLSIYLSTEKNHYGDREREREGERERERERKIYK
jgi:hypothetical protein